MKATMGMILAAGASTRMGGVKALVQTGGMTFLERVSDPYRHAGIPVIIVTGYHADDVETHAKRIGLAWVRNPAPNRGMISSVRTGLHAIPRYIDHVFIHPVDCPGVTTQTLRALSAGLRAFPRAGAAKPTYRHRGGHPLLLSRKTWQRVLSKRQRDLRSAVAESVHFILRVDSGDAAVLNDLDTPAATLEWISRRHD